MKRGLVVATAALVVAGVGWPYAFTVVPIDDGSAPSGAFDPVTFVDGVWDEITTTITGDAVDLADVLTEIAPDEDGRVAKDALIAVTERYGLITPGEAHVYTVRVHGTVVGVDLDSTVGTMELAMDGYAGPVVVQVYIGPRIPSDESSVRDAVGFITFGDFRDQTEYGKVTSEINARVVELLASQDVAALEGQVVTVFGAMTVRTFNLVEIDLSEVHVVPVAIERS